LVALVTTAIVLAAGLSRRMGRPKLLLDLRGKPIIRHTVERLVAAADMDEILVVVGPEHSALERALDGLGVRSW
jgi:molybdenum cofactor cytidylyltransferase